MARFNTLLAAAGLVAGLAAQAHAGAISYSGYSVLNNQNVTLNDAAIGVTNELGGSGQITLANTNTAAGSINSFCVDIADWLQNAGSFSTGTTFGGETGRKINALLSNGIPTLSTSYDASSALQVAIWQVEYGSDLTIATSSSVSGLAATYIANVGNGTWQADPTQAVALLAGGGSNQTQAYLVAVPEPASLAALSAGLIGLALLRRRPA